jgi:hypothetical protein
MSTTNTSTEEREAETAVTEFLEMRAAILGRLSPEALRCVPDILDRHLKERNIAINRTARDSAVTPQIIPLSALPRARRRHEHRAPITDYRQLLVERTDMKVKDASVYRRNPNLTSEMSVMT